MAKRPRTNSSSKSSIRPLIAKNRNQSLAVTSWLDGYNLVLQGSAGTGKTYLGLGLAYKSLLEENLNIVIVRNAVPVRDIGFLPGTLEEKAEVYELPYASLFKEMGVRYEDLKARGSVQFLLTSYVRGITLDNTVVVVDEFQSMNAHELDSIITRLGVGSRVIFCGDLIQSDLVGREASGLPDFLRVLRKMDQFSFIDFTEDDIVRSGLVRDYIIARNSSGLVV